MMLSADNGWLKAMSSGTISLSHHEAFFNTFITLLAGKIGKDSFIQLQDLSFFRLLSFPIILTITLELPMPPAISQPSSDAGLNLTLFTIPQFFLLQMGTASILLLLLAEKASGETLQAIGEASEELFRGDRLPLLNFPNQNDFKQSSKVD